MIIAATAYQPGIGNQYFIRSYESASPGTFPTELVWQTPPSTQPLNARLGDSDGDGKEEIIVAHGVDLEFYENAGDNTYVTTTSVVASQQSFCVADDLDGDGRDEVLSGSIASGQMVRAVEATADDTYQKVWGWDPNPDFNVNFIVDAGDLDHDGKKEFLVGGLESVSGIVLYILEATGNDSYEVVAKLKRPGSLQGLFDAKVADVNGDGNKEIVFGAGHLVTIYENGGDNAWHQIWSGIGGYGGSFNYLGVGDHDGDGKAEVIFRENDTTEVWEIDPAYQADADGDGVVDAIDNCKSVPNPGQADADGEGVGDVCDNCADVSNPGQGAAVLGGAIVAQDAQTFGWSGPVAVEYLRGGLGAVSGYGVDYVQGLGQASGFVDGSVPVAGSGYYYLVKPACAAGSWQSSPGAEPGRDAALP